MLYADIITDAMIKGLGQQKASVRYNILTSSMDVALLFFMLPRWGMMGYFISFAVTHAINFGLSLNRLVKITGQAPPFSEALRSAISAMAGIFAASLVGSPMGKVAVFLTVLFCLLRLLRVISKEDFRWIKGLIVNK
jgi:O-antigen/teichoic acid export membrane protein